MGEANGKLLVNLPAPDGNDAIADEMPYRIGEWRAAVTIIL